MGPAILPHLKQAYQSLAQTPCLKQIAAEYTRRRNKLPFWLLTIVSAIELLLMCAVVIAGVILFVSPLFFINMMWGAPGVILTICGGIVMMAGAGLASERKRDQ